MIEYFKLKNFLSYRNETELSFVASKKDREISDKLEDNEKDTQIRWYKEIDGKRLLRLIIGVGLNGTGKTKMMQALSYMRKLATSRPGSPNALPDYEPFLLDEDSKNQPTEMWLSYYIDNDSYLYYIKVSRERIEEEELRLQKGRGFRIYLRKYDSETDTSIINFGATCDLSKNDQRDLELNTVNNATVMSVFGSMNLNSKILKSNYDYIHNRISHVHQSHSMLADKLDTGDKMHDAKMKELLLQLLRDVKTNIVDYHVDVSSVSIEDLIKKGAPSFITDELKKQYPSGIIQKKDLRFEHSTTHGSLSLDSSFESNGTINIIKLLVVLYDVVLGKKCTSIDEPETGIHLSALEFILRMYLSIADESQIIVATHNLSLLDSKILRRDAVRIFKKDEDAITTVKRHEYVHNTVNFYKRYIKETTSDITEVMEEMDTYNAYRKVIEESKENKDN